ncbi:MAG: T9SS type A sorting domain-containing protein [Bacteroidetes bacterium]|nr:T9SS type A sorting domain-containing protein [Bacteroidota bacterium]
MKKIALILIAIFMVNIANAGGHFSNLPVSKQSLISASTVNTNPSVNPLKVKDVLTTYTITVTSTPPNGGYAFGSGTFNANQSCSVHAFPASGFNFAGWSENGNIVSIDTNYIFILTANRNLTAVFTPILYTITTIGNPTFGGTTTGGGTFTYGQSCTVNAIADTGFAFVNWTGNGAVLSSNANYTFSVYSSRNLIANFTTNPYTINITANPSNGGSVFGGGTFAAGQTCTLIASSNNNYTFANWTENGNVVSTSTSYQFTVNSNRNLVANFTSATFTVTTSSMPVNGGNTYGGGTFYYNQPCVVNATNSNGYTFVNWTINGQVVSFDSIYSFNVDTNMNLVANFSTNPIFITASVSPVNAGNIQGGGMYALNQSCNLIAHPATGYSFANWTENGNTVSTYYHYPFTVTANRNLVAHFNALPTCSAQFTLVPDSTLLHHYFIINNATGAAPLHYVWSWGDGTSDSVAYPSHTYAASGNYNICLTITDALSCSAIFCYNASLQKSTNTIISLQVIQGGVGIRPEKTENQLRIYPNPAKDNLSIESNFKSEQNLDIVNLIGQSVFTTKIYGNTTIDVSALPKGIYFLRLNTNKETVVKKFVKE